MKVKEIGFIFWQILLFLLLLVFFGCVFNEFLVLSCCGLDYETHITVSKRAAKDKLNKSITLLDDLTDDTSEI